MILTHGANSLPSGGGDDVVVIGERRYPTVKIGNLIWMAENLDYKWEGLVMAASLGETPRAAYYNQDENLWGFEGRKCGMLYNWYAADFLENNKLTLLPSGWRVAKVADYNSMLSSLSISNNLAGFKALACKKDENQWVNSAWDGENTSKLNIKPGGILWADYFFEYAGDSASVWTANSTSNTSAAAFFVSGVAIDPGQYVTLRQSLNKLYQRPLRLVKDA